MSWSMVSVLIVMSFLTAPLRVWSAEANTAPKTNPCSSHSGGVFPEVAYHQGALWCAVQTGRGLRIVELNRDQSVRSERILELGEGSLAFPRMSSESSGLWIAFRDASTAKLHNISTGKTEVLGASGGNDPVAVGAGLVAWQSEVQDFSVNVRPLAGGASRRQGPGRPTGLSRILSNGRVTLIDDDRLAAPPGTRPCWAGGLVVTEGPDGGLLVTIGGRTKPYFGTRDTFTPKCAAGSGRYAVTSWGRGDVFLLELPGDNAPGSYASLGAPGATFGGAQAANGAALAVDGNSSGELLAASAGPAALFGLSGGEVLRDAAGPVVRSFKPAESRSAANAKGSASKVPGQDDPTTDVSQLPQLAWISPSGQNAALAKIAKLVGTATDDIGVARVEILVNLKKVGEAKLEGERWSYDLDTTKVPKGAFNLSALAINTRGKAARDTIRAVSQGPASEENPEEPGPGGPAPIGELDLHQAHILNNPPNLADWKVTTKITKLEMRPDGIHVEFSKRNGSGSWPDVIPDGWDEPLQYTLGMAMKIDGKWYASAVIQFWRGLERSGGPPQEYAENWFYAPDRWRPMTGHQPKKGEQIGFFVVAGNVRNIVNGGSQSPLKERSNVVLVPMPGPNGATYTFSGDGGPVEPGPVDPEPEVPVPAGSLDLHQAQLLNNPQNLADWKVSTRITKLEMRPDGIHVEFSKRNGTGSWPDMYPNGWDEPLQYTLGMAMKIDGKWYASAVIQFWRGLERSGGPPQEYAENWFYAADRWAPMTGHQPKKGEQIGFFVVAGNVRNIRDSGSESPVKERSNVVLVPMPGPNGATYTFE